MVAHRRGYGRSGLVRHRTYHVRTGPMCQVRFLSGHPGSVGEQVVFNREMQPITNARVIYV